MQRNSAKRCVYATDMVDAAVLVRSARERAGLSARDLATRCGVSASTVTRIERGEINPTVAMLERLVEASGNELIITTEPRRQPPLPQPLPPPPPPAAAPAAFSNMRGLCC